MKITKFEIANFRGIKSTSIKIASGAPGRITTLIGLNESGKTTLLEAIANFVSLDPGTQKLVETVHTKDDPKTFIPKDRRGRFSDEVSIKAHFEISTSDIEIIYSKIKSKHNIRLDRKSVKSTMTIEKRLKFENSKIAESRNYWTTGPLRWLKGDDPKWISHKAGKGSTDWSNIVREIQSLLPRIVYFPTFLFDLPNRIYLTGVRDDSKNSYYEQIIGNVLKAIDPNYSVEDHIVSRVKALLEGDDLTSISNSDETADIDAVIRDASNELSRVIMGAWHDILGKKKLNQRVEMSWGVDAKNDNAVYVEIFLISGQRKYLLKERSLGFRWFFSFLLFTQFRRIDENARGTIFLFDEPASNLHSAAQTSLLSSLEKVAGESDYLIYSTHSHYMVNPLWLERAYIVENKSLQLLDDLDFQGEPVANDIVATPYAQFVAKNPTRTTYFQPVLDALHYRSSNLVLSGPAVILEGKFDYYPFIYLLSRSSLKLEARCYSANGASEMAILISIFRANNVPFVILLDDDGAGRREKSRYEKDYHVSKDQVITLAEANSTLSGKSFEGIYGSDVIDLVSSRGLAGYGELKSQGSALFQLLSSTNDHTAEIEETLETFDTVVQKINICLDDQKK